MLLPLIVALVDLHRVAVGAVILSQTTFSPQIFLLWSVLICNLMILSSLDKLTDPYDSADGSNP